MGGRASKEESGTPSPPPSPPKSIVVRQTVVHRGLENRPGENNCFLNAVIQALWHVRPFRISLKRYIVLHRSSFEVTDGKGGGAAGAAPASAPAPAPPAKPSAVDQEVWKELPLDVRRQLLEESQESQESQGLDDTTDTPDTPQGGTTGGGGELGVHEAAHTGEGGDAVSPSETDLLHVLCDLFKEYEHTEMVSLPPTQLRLLMSRMSSKFDLGAIADANELLIVILDTLHEHAVPSCDEAKCISHSTFGGVFLEQVLCGKCGATSEPTVQSDQLVHFLYAAELVENADKAVGGSRGMAGAAERSASASGSGKATARRGLLGSFSSTVVVEAEGGGKSASPRRSFGELLGASMGGGMRECPSKAESPMDACRDGKEVAHVALHCLEPPAALYVSVTWASSREDPVAIRAFMLGLDLNFGVSELFPGDEAAGRPDNGRGKRSGGGGGEGKSSLKSSSLKSSWHAGSKRKTTTKEERRQEKKRNEESIYCLRGMVCYYGLHFVSIFQAGEGDGEDGYAQYLLFDDSHIRVIGNWLDVVEEAVKARYQPVLLLFEQKSVTEQEADEVRRSSPRRQGHGQGLGQTSSAPLIGMVYDAPINRQHRDVRPSSAGGGVHGSGAGRGSGDDDASGGGGGGIVPPQSPQQMQMQMHAPTLKQFVAAAGHTGRAGAGQAQALGLGLGLATAWGKQPRFYAVTLTPLLRVPAHTSSGSSAVWDSGPQGGSGEAGGAGFILGCVLDFDEGGIIVTRFSTPPPGHPLYPAEACGKILLLDELLTVNGQSVVGLKIDDCIRILRTHVLVSHPQTKTVAARPVDLQFKSRWGATAWFMCPFCDTRQEVEAEVDRCDVLLCSACAQHVLLE